MLKNGKGKRPFKRNPYCRSSLVAQWVKDPAVSLQQLRSLWWHEFDFASGVSTCHRPRKKKKKIPIL